MTDQDPTKGDNPILEAGPTIEVNGEELTLRRLGIRDTFAVARIVAIGAMAANQNLDSLGKNPDALVTVLLSGLMGAEDTALKLLASIIGVSVKELEDPARFPMGTELQIIEALVEHQDLKAFLSRVGALAKRLPEMQTRSPAAST